MLRTIATLAVAGFVFKRACPRAYEQTVTALTDVVDSVSDVTTAVRGQVKAYTAEACADATQRLSAVDPTAIEKLRAMLDGTALSQQPAAPRRVAPRHRP